MELKMERESVIEKIQSFWAEALANHEIIGEMVNDQDIEVFEYMKTLKVIHEHDQVNRGQSGSKVEIIFTFKENNPYFHNSKLEKILETNEKGETIIKYKPIRWKGDRSKRDINDDDSFFDWYEDDS